MIRYVFRDLALIPGGKHSNAQTIGEELSSIARANGGELKPQAVLETARNSLHILHRHFDWNDETAAEKFRLDQARALIRSIHVEEGDSNAEAVPAFISISGPAGKAYYSLQAVRTDIVLQERVIEAAARDLAAWRKRYESLKEICALVRAAEEKLWEKRGKPSQRPQPSA